MRGGVGHKVAASSTYTSTHHTTLTSHKALSALVIDKNPCLLLFYRHIYLVTHEAPLLVWGWTKGI